MKKVSKRFQGLHLTAGDRKALSAMASHGAKMTARVWRRIRMLQMLDTGETMRAVGHAVGAWPREVSRVAKRYLIGGLEHALSEDARAHLPGKLDSVQKAAVVALVCGPPPEGQARWSVRLLAEEVVTRKIISEVGRETIRLVLAEHDIKPWREKNVVRAGY